MTVNEIQSTVAMYLQRSVEKFDVAGTDANLILIAMNNARKYAERRHNWSVCRKKGYLSVTTGNKVAWESPTWFDGGTEKMKEGKHWWMRSSTNVVDEWVDGDTPLKVIQHGVKHVVETKRQYEAWGDEWTRIRQLSEDGVGHPLLGQAHGVVRGKWLELYPRPSVTQKVLVDGYCWWPEWTGLTGQVTRTWTFTAESDYLLVDASVYSFFLDIRPDGTSARRSLRLIRSGATPLSSFVELSEGHASAFITGWTLSNLVHWFNELIVDGSVTNVGNVITITITGDDPLLDVANYDSSGALLQSGALTATSDTSDISDWWTENAEEFLILRTLVECNRLGHVFTGNKEGNLPSPEKQADQALQDLISQDCGGEMAGGQIELY